MMDESIFKEFMCFDRNIYYIFKTCYNIEFTEMLFIDRYLGFYRNEERDLVNHQDGLSRFLMEKGILERISIPIDKVEEYINERVAPKGYRAIACVNLFYPDKEKPFPYTSYIIIEKYGKEVVNLTKLSNVEQKIRYDENKAAFVKMFMEDNGLAEIFIIKNVKTLKQVDNIEKSLKVKYVLEELYGYNEEQLGKKYQNITSQIDIFAETGKYHQNMLEEYLSNGITRNKYSLFARRFNEMIFPSLICYDVMRNNGVLTKEYDDLESSKNKLVEELSAAHRNILAFIWTKDTQLFTAYLNNMAALNEIFKKYQSNYHRLVIDQLNA